MTWRADTVMRLLEDVRRLSLPEGAVPRENQPASSAPNVPEDNARPPKRPWEDMSHEEPAAPAPSASYPDVSCPSLAVPSVADVLQAQFEVSDRVTAEKDMEIIRSKRATSTSASAPGQPKSKYRKRSVSATCSHSCSHASLIFRFFSVPLLLANVTRVISVKRRSGGVARMGRGPYATLAACVSSDFCLTLRRAFISLVDVDRLREADAEARQGRRWKGGPD